MGTKDQGAAQAIFGPFALKDFWHDFKHANLTDALEIVGKSYDPACNLSIVKYQKQFINLKKAIENTGTAYRLFEGAISKILPPPPSPPGAYEELTNNENAATAKIGLELEALKDRLLQIGQELPTVSPLANMPVVEIKGNIPNTYSVSACPTKIRSERYSIASAFGAVAPGKRNFVLILDASFVSMSEIRLNLPSLIPGYNPEEQYNFYLLESNENQSDPATKLANIAAPAPGEPTNIHVYFLRDEGHTSEFPAFPAHDPSVTAINQMSNLFTTLSLKSYRDKDGLISVVVTKNNGTTVTINDVGSTSEINQATIFALKRCVEYGWDGATDHLGLEAWEEILLYFLLKRAGDWCQALCLLDRDRVYKTYDVNNKYQTGKDTTINKIKELDTTTEIFLMTHDRILLAYALYMGLNVAYSIRTVVAAIETDTSTSMTWLVYFKNTMDAVISSDELEKKRTEVNNKLFDISNVAGAFKDNATQVNDIVRIVASQIPGVFTRDFKLYMMVLRLTFVLLKQLVAPYDYEPIVAAVSEKAAGIATLTYMELLELDTNIKKILTMYANNGLILENIGKVAASNLRDVIDSRMLHLPSTIHEEELQINTVDELLKKTGNIFTPNHGPVAEYQSFQYLVLHPLSNDIKIVQEKLYTGDVNLDMLRALRTFLTPAEPTGLSRTQMNKYMDVRKDIIKVLSQVQTGGGDGDDFLINNIQNNIISLDEKLEPYDLTEASNVINELFPSNPTAMDFLQRKYIKYIGELNEPALTDFICEYIFLCIEKKVELGDEDPEVQALLKEYKVPVNFNVFRCGMKFIDTNNDSYTVVDKFLILPEQGNAFKTIIERSGIEGYYSNPLATSFIDCRFPLYIIDMLENLINKIPMIDDDEGYTGDDVYTGNFTETEEFAPGNSGGNAVTGTGDVTVMYDDNEFMHISAVDRVLSYLTNPDDDDDDADIVGKLYNYWFNDKNEMPKVDTDRTETRKSMLEKCAICRFDYIIRYYTTIGKPFNYGTYIDLVLNVLPESALTTLLMRGRYDENIKQSLRIAAFITGILGPESVFPSKGKEYANIVGLYGSRAQFIVILYQSLYYASQNMVYRAETVNIFNALKGICTDDRYKSLERDFPDMMTYEPHPTIKDEYTLMALLHGSCIRQIILGNAPLVQGYLNRVVPIISHSKGNAAENTPLIYAEIYASIINTLLISGNPEYALRFVTNANLPRPAIELINKFLAILDQHQVPVPAGGGRKARKNITRRRANKKATHHSRRKSTRRRR